MTLSPTPHPEPRQAGSTNSHSAAFPHDPRLRLEVLTEPCDTSRDNRPFTAHADQPKLAPHHIPSPALSPLSLPSPVLPITHDDAVPPFHESPAAPPHRLTASPQADPAPYPPRHHASSSARASPLALRLDTTCGPPAAAAVPQQECSHDSADSDDDMGSPLPPSASSSVLRERYFPSEEEGEEGKRPRRPSEHDLRRGLIHGEPSTKPDTPLDEPGAGAVRIAD